MAIDFGDNNTEHGIPMGAYVPSSGGGGGQIEWVTFPNAVMIGEPVINGSQISGFTTTDYMMFPFILDVHDRPFEVNFSFTTGDDVTTQQNILDSRFGLALAIQNGHGLMAISNNGESWASTAAGLLDIMPNTTYYAKLTWNRLQYKTALSVDGKTFIDDMLVVNATRPYPRTMYIGGGSVEELGHSVHPFQGIIDMKNASLLVDGNTVWLGMDDPGLATRADISLSNLDAAGEARFTAKQDKLIAMDGVMIEGNEISANVDGKTVKINGSGQLEAAGGSGDLRGVAPIAVEDKIESPLHNGLLVSDASTNTFYSTSATSVGEGLFLDGYGNGGGEGILSNNSADLSGQSGIGIDLDTCFANGYILAEYQPGRIVRIRNSDASRYSGVMHFGYMADGKFVPVAAEQGPGTTKYQQTGEISSATSTKVSFASTGCPGTSDYTFFGQSFSAGERLVQINPSSVGSAFCNMGPYAGYGNKLIWSTSTDSTFRSTLDKITHVVVIPALLSGSYGLSGRLGTPDHPLRLDIYEGLAEGIELYDSQMMTDIPAYLNTRPSLFSVDATEYTQVSFEGEFVEAPVIIDSFVDGASGYTVWSKDKNGKNRCEQWGHSSPASSNQPISISLTKTYADTNYQVFKGYYCKGTAYGPASYDATAAVYNNATKTPSSFQSYNLDGWYGFDWRTVGYLAEGQYDV